MEEKSNEADKDDDSSEGEKETAKKAKFKDSFVITKKKFSTDSKKSDTGEESTAKKDSPSNDTKGVSKEQDKKDTSDIAEKKAASDDVTQDQDSEKKKSSGATKKTTFDTQEQEIPEKDSKLPKKKEKDTSEAKHSENKDGSHPDSESSSSASKDAESAEKDDDSENKEKIPVSMLKIKGSPSGPVDLFYLFRKYSDGGNSSIIKLDLVHKWLEQANIYNDDTGVTKQYTEELFAEHSNNQDTMEFNDFLKFLHTISQEKNQDPSEMVHKLLTAGKPRGETEDNWNMQRSLLQNLNKIYTGKNHSDEGESKKENESSDAKENETSDAKKNESSDAKENE
ncbi:uncharacterized protein CDAR_573791, partial [Caerostris darwini]